MTIEEVRTYFAQIPARKAAVASAALLCIAACAAYAMRNPDTPAVIARMPTQAEGAEAPYRIEGLETAARREALRNPFTHVHETRGAAAQIGREVPVAPPAAKPADTPAAGGGAGQPTAAAPGAAVQAQTKAERPVLRGIVTGADGTRMAILAQGEDSTVLSAGDGWRSYTVAYVADGSVTLETAHGTIVLRQE